MRGSSTRCFGPLTWRETLLFTAARSDHAGQLQKIATALAASRPALMRLVLRAGPKIRLGRASAYVTERAPGRGRRLVPEAWGTTASTPLAFMAARTTRIRLGTGNSCKAAPLRRAAGHDRDGLQAMSEWRFVLGLGVSGPQVIEGWHGHPLRPPVQRMRETVDIVRRAIKGERLEYKGKVYELPLRAARERPSAPAAPPQPSLPIYLATLSPQSLEMTGEIADGWLGTSFMPEHAHVSPTRWPPGRPARAARRAARSAGGGFVASARTWSA